MCRVQRQVQQFQDSVQWGNGQWVCMHIRRTDLKIYKVSPKLPLHSHVGTAQACVLSIAFSGHWTEAATDVHELEGAGCLA